MVDRRNLVRHPFSNTEMLYYIDTNGLYNIRKFDKDKINSCLTSVMAILELVSGVTQETFNKRKAILGMVYSSGITIDYAYPEEIVFNSFDAFHEYQFVESREEPLTNLVKGMVNAKDYEEYVLSKSYNSEYGHQFFKEIDQNLSKNFFNSSQKGVKEVKRLQQSDSPENLFTFNEITYDLNTRKGLEAAFPLFSRASTILGMALLALRHADTTLTVEDILPSYNGLTAVYVDVFSRYCDNLMLNSNLPSENDALDLIHLLYLKNDYRRFIVSDDKIFKKFFPDNTLSLNAIFRSN